MGVEKGPDGLLGSISNSNIKKVKKMQENMTPSMRGLDFDEDDIIFASYVKYAFERKRQNDLAAAQELEKDEKDARAQKWLEKYLQRQSRIQILKKGYHALQKVAVFVVIVFIGFSYAVVNVEAVNQAVVGWLTEVHQTHTDLSVNIGQSDVDLSQVQIGWLPEGMTIERLPSTTASFTIYYNGQPTGSIVCQNSGSNMSVNTENAKTSYLDLKEFDKTLLVERENSIILVASSENIIITIIVDFSADYIFSVGEILNILQNIEYN